LCVLSKSAAIARFVEQSEIFVERHAYAVQPQEVESKLFCSPLPQSMLSKLDDLL